MGNFFFFFTLLVVTLVMVEWDCSVVSSMVWSCRLKEAMLKHVNVGHVRSIGYRAQSNRLVSAVYYSVDARPQLHPSAWRHYPLSSTARYKPRQPSYCVWKYLQQSFVISQELLLLQNSWPIFLSQTIFCLFLEHI